ncbi:TPA: hypothetical protein HA265_07890 [Candidatus Woesearchaeota archaeon]|nr:hypothetical protein [Candidatus Woesearchaeota archaeon]
MTDRTMDQLIQEGRERLKRVEARLDDIRIHRGKGPIGIDGVVDDVVLFFTNRTNRDAGLYRIPADMLARLDAVKRYSDEERQLQLEIDDLVNTIFDDYIGFVTSRGDIEGITCVVVGGVRPDYRELPDAIILTPRIYANHVTSRLRTKIGEPFTRKSTEERHQIADGSPFASYKVHVDENGKLHVTPQEVLRPDLEGKRIYESMEEYLSEGDGCCGD